MTHDEKLQKAVIAQLHWEPSVDAAQIGVTSADGVVTLIGHVETFAEKHAAEVAPRLVKGEGRCRGDRSSACIDAKRDDDGRARCSPIGRLNPSARYQHQQEFVSRRVGLNRGMLR